MPGNTSRDKLRWPLGTEAPDGPTAFQNLATDIENTRVFVGSRQVKDTGVLNHTRAGRVLDATDFTNVLGLTTPVGLFNLGGLTNLGSGAALTNKGTVPFAPGITGAASEAALFAWSPTQVLYTNDTGANDPFRIKTGTVFGWHRSARRGTEQIIASKYRPGAGTAGWLLEQNTANQATFLVSVDGTAINAAVGATDVCDDRWHFIVGTFDGTVIRVYVDGVLDGVTTQSGFIFGPAVAFNIGGAGADAGTGTTLPHSGRVDEVGVTPDVLNEDEIRMLMCVKVPHGFTPGALTRTVRKAGMTVQRSVRGAPMVTGDFPATPLRLHNFTAAALTDAGSNNVPLAAVGGGVITDVSGADGARSGAMGFSGAHTGLGATDTGLPSGVTSRSYGAWVKTSTIAQQTVLVYGTLSGSQFTGIILDATGKPVFGGSFATAVSTIADGQWHFLVGVEENTPTDSQKIKGYVDGRLTAISTLIGNLVLAGANKFRVGADSGGATPFVGSIDGVFVENVALTPEQVLALYLKSARTLGISPAAPEYVERVDDTNLYVLCDGLEPQHTLEFEVTS
jgi:hypothetical protein